METINEFYNRIYVNFTNDQVMVFKSKIHKNKIESVLKPEIWDILTTRNYLNWLENEQNR